VAMTWLTRNVPKSKTLIELSSQSVPYAKLTFALEAGRGESVKSEDEIRRSVSSL
jgi:hypothetical protein